MNSGRKVSDLKAYNCEGMEVWRTTLYMNRRIVCGGILMIVDSDKPTKGRLYFGCAKPQSQRFAPLGFVEMHVSWHEHPSYQKITDLLRLASRLIDHRKSKIGTLAGELQT